MSAFLFAGLPEDSPLGALPLAEILSDDYRLIGKNYALLEMIGQGGAGEVWRGRQLSTGRKVAIKIIRIGSAEERVSREVAALAKLSHPGIVSIIDAGVFEKRPFIVMELVEGTDLARLIAGQPLPVPRAVAIIEEAALALQRAHSLEILHRDLKPGNILVSHEGRAKVSDFGMAKHLSGSLDLTQAGDLIGTPAYMAPEQIDARWGDLSAATDIYGLGATFYHAITGVPPFRASGKEACFRLIETIDPAAPRLLNAAIPRDIDTICLRALAKDPSQRYRTMEEFAADLARWRRGEPIRARPVSLVVRSALWARRQPGMAALAVLAFVFAAAGLLGILRERVHLKQANEKLVQTVAESRLAQATSLFQAGDTTDGLRVLARHLRENPRDMASTRRLFNAVRYRPFLWPAAHLESQPGHAAEIEWSADGKWLMGVSYTDTNEDLWITLWNAESRQKIETRKFRKDLLVYAGFSPDSRWIIVGSRERSMFFSVTNYAPRGLDLPAASTVQSLAFTPDCGSVIIVDEHGIAKRWALDTFAPLPALDLGGPVRSIDFSATNWDEPPGFNGVPRGSDSGGIQSGGLALMASGEVFRLDQSLKRAGPPLLQLSTNAVSVAGADLHDRLVAVVEMGPEAHRIELYSISSRRLLYATNADSAQVSPDGNWTLLNLDPTSAMLVDNRTGEPHAGRWTNLSLSGSHNFSPDSKRVLAAGATTSSLNFYSVPDASPLCEPVSQHAFFQGAGLSRDGRFFAAGCYSDYTVLWQADPARQDPAQVPAGLIAFSPDSRRFATASTNRLQIWEAAGKSAAGPGWVYDSNIVSVFFAAGGQSVGAAHGSHFTMQDLRLGEPGYDLSFSNAVTASAFSPDGRTVVLATEESSLHFHRASDGLILRAPQTMTTGFEPARARETNIVLGLRFSPDGRYFAAALFSGDLQIWSGDGSSRIQVFSFPTPVWAFDFSPDGNRVAAGGFPEARVLNIHTGQAETVPMVHDTIVSSIHYSPDGKTLLTTSLDGRAHVWDANSGRLLCQTRQMSADVTWAEFSPDGGSFATACKTEGICLWDTATALPVGEAFGAGNQYLRVHFSPDGQWLASEGSPMANIMIDLPALPTEAPSWLADLGEALSGGSPFQEGPEAALSADRRLLLLREKLRTLSSSDPLARILLPPEQ